MWPRRRINFQRRQARAKRAVDGRLILQSNIFERIP
jgi:hypothetical protein